MDPSLDTSDQLPELVHLRSIMDRGSRWLRCEQVLSVQHGDKTLPVWVLELGNPRPGVPVFGLFGGVHGVERIGSQIVLAWLHTLVERLHWDDALHRRLEQVRLVIMPIVNPGGMALRKRSNPAGVDLMRNAPIDAMGKVPFLVGGHRLGPWLPWYRGRRGAPMEPEATALIRVVQERVMAAPFSMTLDCHSGFGRQDRLWSCYARSHRPITHIAEVYALRQLMQRSNPHMHHYLIEPQSVNYTTHGDLWDYLYDAFVEAPQHRLFLPFTLEMGSWLWVRKNPRQALDFLGYFNPVIDHRHHRVLRQHMPLLEFLSAATGAWDRWIPLPKQRPALTRDALQLWFHEPDQPASYPPPR
ncbi:MAG: M14 family zinc carboxypeptidase [Alcanivoracaceae bacterium]